MDRVAVRLQARVARQARRRVPPGLHRDSAGAGDQHPVLPVDPGAARGHLRAAAANDATSPPTVGPARPRARTYGPEQPSRDVRSTPARHLWRVRPARHPVQRHGRPGHLLRPAGLGVERPGACRDVHQLRDRDGSRDRHRRSGLGHRQRPCADMLCDGVPTTPVLSWDAQPGITHYRVYVSEDANFTNLVSGGYSTTTNTRSRSAPVRSPRRSPRARPARRTTGTSGRAQESPAMWSRPGVPEPGAARGRRPSARRRRRVAGLAASDTSASEITFTWNDYFDTNRATDWRGELGNQSAQKYRIQVDTEPSFVGLSWTPAIVDQATYTAVRQALPRGHALLAGPGARRGRQRPHLVPVAVLHQVQPGGASAVPRQRRGRCGHTPFTWQPQAFAAAYTIEVYKNNDAAFSTANRVFTATIKTPAYAWDQAVPRGPDALHLAGAPHRRHGQPGPWSTPARFSSLGAIPTLVAPANNVWQPTAGPLFEWTEVAGAATYALERQRSQDRQTSASPRPTPTAVAAHGRRTRGTSLAYDGAGKSSDQRDPAVPGRRHAAFSQEGDASGPDLHRRPTIKVVLQREGQGRLGTADEAVQAEGCAERRSG